MPGFCRPTGATRDLRLPEILDRQRVLRGMERILISEAVAPSGGVDDYTGVLYYEMSLK